MIKIRSGYFFVKNFLPLKIDVSFEDNALIRISFVKDPALPGEGSDTPLIQEIRSQLKEYFEGRLQNFNIPVRFAEGTSFQQKVWKTLQRIPYGEVVSYKQIAEAVGIEKGFRAIGMANNKNPIPIIIPCHRVVNHSGQLGGYAPGLEWKIKLLSLENIPVQNNKITKPLYSLKQED